MVGKKKYNQICVWPGTFLGESSVKDFENFFKEKGFRVRFLEEVETLPDVKNGKIVEGTGGRHDIFFLIHDDDIPKYAVWRLAYGMRWWEDVLDNGGGVIYSDEILKKYPYGWKK